MGHAECRGADPRRSAASARRYRRLQRVSGSTAASRPAERRSSSIRPTGAFPSRPDGTPAIGRAPQAPRPSPRTVRKTVSPGERCAHHTKAGPPMSAGGYNNHLRLFQTPRLRRRLDRAEPRRAHHSHGRPSAGRRGHPAMDGRFRAAGGRATRWSSRRPNFNGKNLLPGIDPRHAPGRAVHPHRGRIVWSTSTTVSDPASYTRPWTASITMTPIEGDLYEFACHEGNYGMEGILAGARADEAEMAASR